jgi:hypothetical protein
MAASKRHGILYYFFCLTAIFLLYNIAGVYYNTRRHRLRGVEAIPHIDKWRQMPDLLNQLLSMAVDRSMIYIALVRGYANRKIQGYKQTL